MRKRDRHSGLGLLPRMQARPRADGLTTYRYKPIDGPWVNLGTDKEAAIRKALDLNNESPDRGTINHLWKLYSESAEWKALADASRDDYTQSSKQLLKRFGMASPEDITPQVCARYLRVERAAAPTRANREMALLSNLMNVAVERGDLVANPCKQVRRNKERPRKTAPEPETLVAFLEWARKRPGQAQVLAGMAEFAALAGNRRIEFRSLSWAQVGDSEVRLMRGKQRDGNVVVEVISISPALRALLDRMKVLAKNDKLGAVFPTVAGNTYTDRGFKTMWNRLITAALQEKAIPTRFTFHDLRAYYVTQHKQQRGALPDLHANPGTTARIYDRSKMVKRSGL
jgi:site-specific recombinase XerD